MEAKERVERSIEASAKTVDEAINQALAQLGVTREQTRIEVLREGSRGILGFGAEDARVRVTLLPPPAPSMPPVPPTVPAEPTPPAEAAEPVPLPPPPVPTPKELPIEGDASPMAKKWLEGLLEAMGVTAHVEARVENDPEDPTVPVLILNIRGNDLEMLRRGETLSAIQLLTSLVMSKQLGHRSNVFIDVEGYRKRREHILSDLAKRMADRVANDGRMVVMEPMPAYERRIIHLALRDHPNVTTYSVGDGDKRKVTIRLKK